MNKTFNQNKLIELGSDLSNQVYELLNKVNESSQEHNINIIEKNNQYHLELSDYNKVSLDTDIVVMANFESFYNKDFLFDEFYTEIAWFIFSELKTRKEEKQ